MQRQHQPNQAQQTLKHSIRQQMRAQRRALSNKQQQMAANNIQRQAQGSAAIMSAKRVLAYQPFAGEISPQCLIQAMNIENLYLPRITHYRRQQMQFYPSRRMSTCNRYGILEPCAIGSPAKPNEFDLILVPLLAFGRNGSRIGMGSGYYDRALVCLDHQQSTRPNLVGMAHHFQETRNLNPEPWDIPLDAILTDREFININL